jgi:hypothetical protein
MTAGANAGTLGRALYAFAFCRAFSWIAAIISYGMQDLRTTHYVAPQAQNLFSGHNKRERAACANACISGLSCHSFCNISKRKQFCAFKSNALKAFSCLN